jgi:hypothetical protein
LAYLLFRPPLIRRRIGQSLPDDTLQAIVGAVQIVNAIRYPVIIPEIELSKVSVKMLLAPLKRVPKTAVLVPCG